MRPQTATILRHLKSGRSITSAYAIENYGNQRLSEHIRDLRYRGYGIETTLHRNAKNNGNYAVYHPVKMTLGDG